MLSQFRRADDEQTTAYRRRLLETFVSSVVLAEDGATVCFNLSASDAADADRISVPFSASSKNKNPAESDENSSNSAGSTALRLVEAMGVELITGDSTWKIFDFDPQIVSLLWLKIPLTE